MRRTPPILAALLLSAAPALAQDADGTTPQASGQKSTAEYLSDLEGDDAPDRLYAARVLRGQLKHSLWVEAHARPGSLASDDARALLVELTERLPGACTDALAFKGTVAPCADVLGMLGTREALPALQALLVTEKRKGVRKRLEKAIAALQ